MPPGMCVRGKRTFPSGGAGLRQPDRTRYWSRPGKWAGCGHDRLVLACARCRARGGLVHRDVKPANMLVDAWPGRPDHVYLSDFGLAKGGAGPALTGMG
jgi:hypothetical protein